MPQERKRVVWFEGMTLDPHHFQQSDRYYHGVLNARVRALNRFDWGLSSLEIDKERLANGELAVVRGVGVMPDGMAFDMPEADPVPEPRSINDVMSSTDDRLAVYLSTPVEQQNGGNFLLQGSPNRRETRYQATSIFAPDENTGTDARQLEVALPRFSIRFGSEPMQTYVSIQIAEVMRTSSGTFVLNERFIPTCLTVTASERLAALTRKLLELVVAKSTSLVDRQRGAAMQREMSPSDVLALGLYATVNTYIPVLNHQLSHADSHPEAIYRTLLALGGQLTAYVPEAGVHPRNFPAYDHAQLSGCFNKMEEFLVGMLGGAKVQANYIEIPLEQRREHLYGASIERDLLSSAQFFLIARSDQMDEQQIIAEVPKQLRIASPETIDAVLRSYTRALNIEHTHRVPSALPVDNRASYFELQKRGPFWEAITQTEGLAVFIPKELESLNLKLVAVK